MTAQSEEALEIVLNETGLNLDFFIADLAIEQQQGQDNEEAIQ